MVNAECLKHIIDSITINSCPDTINLHCHTTFSDGSLNPVQLIKQANSLNLKHLAITDHHSVQAYHIINEWLSVGKNSHSNNTKVWSGLEISCILNSCLVHILGLDVNINHQSLEPYVNGDVVTGDKLQAVNVIKAIKSSGGLSILAHPGRYRIPFKPLIIEAHRIGIDGVETWYDYEFNEIWSPSEYICESVERLASSLGLLKTCGTDSHGLSLRGR